MLLIEKTASISGKDSNAVFLLCEMKYLYAGTIKNNGNFRQII